MGTDPVVWPAARWAWLTGQHTHLTSPAHTCPNALLRHAGDILSLFIERPWGSKVTTLSEISWSQLSYGFKKKKNYNNFLYLDSVFYDCPPLLMTIFLPYTHLRFEGYAEREDHE